ncbi:MAG: hypothetical protein LC637_13645, partial [Xanthomonadaceae bacterium]|nr:hypothetical protein [Xanthomonadaceae bacterium]
MKLLTLLILMIGLSTAIATTPSPLGLLEANAGFSIRSSQADQFVRFGQPSYTWFEGDTIRITAGEALLNLNRGGSIGFPKGTEASVSSGRNDRLRVELQAGAILYSLPSS